MHASVRGACRALILPVLVATLAAGCSSSGGDGNPGPGPSGNPHVAITAIFSSADIAVFTVRPDWSPSGDAIVFAAGSGGIASAHIWRVAPTAGAMPVAVTNPDSSDWEACGYTPGFLADGRIVYYAGWIAEDHDMHVLAAAPGTVRLDPAPLILRSFNGSDFGWDPGTASSPYVMSVSGAGTRALCLWGSTLYTLDWSTGSLVVNELTGTTGTDIWDPILSRDGSEIAYCHADHRIMLLPFAGGTPEEAAQGWYPSFSGDSNHLGYATFMFDAYVVRNLSAGTSVSYSLSGSPMIQNAALSWDAAKIVFRTFEGASTGLSIGTLVP